MRPHYDITNEQIIGDFQFCFASVLAHPHKFSAKTRHQFDLSTLESCVGRGRHNFRAVLLR